MRTSHFRRIDKIEPIVGYNFAGNIQYETAQWVALIGIGMNAPILSIQIFVDWAFNIDPALLRITSLRPWFAIDDISTQRWETPRFVESVLNSILYPFDRGSACSIVLHETRQHICLNNLTRSCSIEFLRGQPRFDYCLHNFFRIKVPHGSITLDEMQRERFSHYAHPQNNLIQQ